MIPEVIINCNCGADLHMKHDDFMCLLRNGNLEGFNCDRCNLPMANIVLDPLVEV